MIGSFLGFVFLLICFVANEWIMGSKAMVQAHLFRNKLLLAKSVLRLLLSRPHSFPFSTPSPFNSSLSTTLLLRKAASGSSPSSWAFFSLHHDLKRAGDFLALLQAIPPHRCHLRYSRQHQDLHLGRQYSDEDLDRLRIAHRSWCRSCSADPHDRQPSNCTR